MKKTFISLILLVLMILPITGCSEKNDKNVEKACLSSGNKVPNSRKLSDSWNGRLGKYTAQVPREVLKKGITDKTVLYSRFKFFDYKTLNEIVLCNKPNCKHYDDSCNACFKMNDCFSFPIIFGYKDKIYLVTNREIFSMNEDGTEHKKVIELPEDVGIGFANDIQGFLVGDILYLQTEKDLEMKFDKNGDPLDGESPSEYVLLKINLKNNSIKRLYKYNYTNDYDQQWIGISNNKAYYFYTEQIEVGRGALSRKRCEELENELDTKLISVDLKTGKETVEFNSKSKYYYHLKMEDDFIYYQDRTKGEIIKYNPKSKKKKVLVKDIFEYTNFLEIGLKNNKLFYEIDYDCLDYYTKKDSKDVTCYVDIDTCEVTEVKYRYDAVDPKYSNLDCIPIETPEYFIIPVKEVKKGKDDFETHFGKIKKKDFWDKNYKVEEIEWKW